MLLANAERNAYCMSEVGSTQCKEATHLEKERWEEWWRVGGTGGAGRKGGGDYQMMDCDALYGRRPSGEK